MLSVLPVGEILARGDRQVGELRRQIATLQSMLNLAAEEDAQSNVQIEALGAQLNAALARAAQEESRRADAEEALRLELERQKE